MRHCGGKQASKSASPQRMQIDAVAVGSFDNLGTCDNPITANFEWMSRVLSFLANLPDFCVVHAGASGRPSQSKSTLFFH